MGKVLGKYVQEGAFLFLERVFRIQVWEYLAYTEVKIVINKNAPHGYSNNTADYIVLRNTDADNPELKV